MPRAFSPEEEALLADAAAQELVDPLPDEAYRKPPKQQEALEWYRRAVRQKEQVKKLTEVHEDKQAAVEKLRSE